MPAIETEEQYGSFLKKIGVTYFGPDFTKETKGHVTISDLDTVRDLRAICLTHCGLQHTFVLLSISCEPFFIHLTSCVPLAVCVKQCLEAVRLVVLLVLTGELIMQCGCSLQ